MLTSRQVRKQISLFILVVAYNVIGKDEEAFKQDINRSAAVGAKFHNMMIWAKHADGHYVTNEEVAKTYIDFYTYAQSKGITVTFRVPR